MQVLHCSPTAQLCVTAGTDQIIPVLPQVFWSYIRLLQHALYKLPPAGVSDAIFRGVGAPSPDITLAELDRIKARHSSPAVCILVDCTLTGFGVECGRRVVSR